MELNPGPHQIDIVSYCCYDSLSKLSTLDMKNVSGLGIPDLCKIELEIESVPTCQEPCCKHDIQLAYMSSLMLLLGGDVELNPGCG